MAAAADRITMRHRNERNHFRSHGIEQCRIMGRDDDINAPTGSLFTKHAQQQLGTRRVQAIAHLFHHQQAAFRPGQQRNQNGQKTQ